MATMADVARSAGVSVATVSHVLNDTRPVLPHTRQAVMDAVDRLGYSPNTLARSLVTSCTRSIGLAVSAISNPYFTEILQGVEATALEHGYSLLIADPHDDPEHERKVVQLLHERRVDGMIVAPSADPSELVAYLGRHGVPAVFLDRRVDSPADGTPRYDQVCTESTEPTARLVTHLAEPRPPPDRPGRRRARVQHHPRTHRRIPQRPRRLRAPPRRTPRGARQLRVRRRRTCHCAAPLPHRPAHRARHRQQCDDHRRTACAAGTRPVRAR